MKLALPSGPFSAYLFDCDGTIADSMPLHFIAWKQALAEWNRPFDENLFYVWGGKPIAEIISTLNARDGLTMPVETVARRKEARHGSWVSWWFRISPLRLGWSFGFRFGS